MNNLTEWAGRGALASIAVTIALTTIIGLARMFIKKI
jgi:hypothetical protein